MIALVMLGMVIGTICTLGGFLLAQRTVDRDVAKATAEGYRLAKEEFGSIFPALDQMYEADNHAVLSWRHWKHTGETEAKFEVDGWTTKRSVAGKITAGDPGPPAFTLAEWAMTAVDRYHADHPLRLAKGA